MKTWVRVLLATMFAGLVATILFPRRPVWIGITVTVVLLVLWSPTWLRRMRRGGLQGDE